MDDLIAIQQEEILALRARVRELEAMLAPEAVRIPDKWGLVNAERRCFAALAARDVVTKEILWNALYGDRRDLDSEPALSVVESHMSRLRKKLVPFGVVITSERFVGYSLKDRAKYLAPPAAPSRAEARVHG